MSEWFIKEEYDISPFPEIPSCYSRLPAYLQLGDGVLQLLHAERCRSHLGLEMRAKLCLSLELVEERQGLVLEDERRVAEAVNEWTYTDGMQCNIV